MITKLLSIPKTIWFNLKYLPLKQAVRLPVWVHWNTHVRVQRGGIVLKGLVTLAQVRYGFHEVPVMNFKDQSSIIIDEGGKLIFEGTAHIGKGTKINVSGGVLTLGNDFKVSASTQINCYHKITFGKDIQFAWDCLVMDSDTHKIFDENDYRINEDKEIILGDSIWIGCRSTILKGSVIPSNTVIGACSFVSGKGFESKSIIAGVPAIILKKIGRWEL